MPRKQRSRLRGQPTGLYDFRVVADESGLSSPSIDHLRQAAAGGFRRQSADERVHRLDAWAVFELLNVLIKCRPGITVELDERLVAYAERLNQDLLRAARDDR